VAKDKYDPYQSFRQMSELWEKQMNNLFHASTDNTEFVNLAKVGLESHARYMEQLRKNQELMASLMNIPTKSDLKNVAKLTIQAEEKIDALEEQVWSLQDSFKNINQENMGLFSELVKITKQMKTELTKNAKELGQAKKMKAELEALRKDLATANDLKAEIQELRLELAETNAVHAEVQELRQELAQFMRKADQEKDQEKELVLAGTGSGK
jgi:predicted RNase H-like nuclease (RuvC/YqgF family)